MSEDCGRVRSCPSTCELDTSSKGPDGEKRDSLSLLSPSSNPATACAPNPVGNANESATSAVPDRSRPSKRPIASAGAYAVSRSLRWCEAAAAACAAIGEGSVECFRIFKRAFYEHHPERCQVRNVEKGGHGRATHRPVQLDIIDRQFPLDVQRLFIPRRNMSRLCAGGSSCLLLLLLLGRCGYGCGLEPCEGCCHGRHGVVVVVGEGGRK